MKKIPTIEKIIDILNKAKEPQQTYQLCSNAKLPYVIGKPTIDEMLRLGLIENIEEGKKAISQKGLNYLHDFNELNKKYGIESAMKLLEEKKRIYNQNKK